MTERRPLPKVEGTHRIERTVGPVRPVEPVDQPATEHAAEATAAAEPQQQPADPPGQQLATVPDAARAAASQPPQHHGHPPHGPVHLVIPPMGQEQRAATPRAEDILQPRDEIKREGLHAMVPTALRLKKRMGQYTLDTDLQARDQVAFAVDAWLRERGY